MKAAGIVWDRAGQSRSGTSAVGQHADSCAAACRTAPHHLRLLDHFEPVSTRTEQPHHSITQRLFGEELTRPRELRLIG